MKSVLAVVLLAVLITASSCQPATAQNGPIVEGASLHDRAVRVAVYSRGTSGFMDASRGSASGVT